MRYVGQSFEIDVPWTSGLRFISGFHSAHRSRYGYADSARPTEIVSVRVRAIGVTDKPRLARSRASTRRKPKPISVEKVFVDERAVPAPIYDREELRPGMRFGGPAVVIEYGSTTLLPGGRTAQVDQWLNLIIE
jgi:N-methylhydantoinase A